MKTYSNQEIDRNCFHLESASSSWHFLGITHNDPQNFLKCGLCCKTFLHKEYLKKHIHRVHEQQKNHRCNICDKSFAEIEYLRKHVRSVHNGLKNYKCVYCEKLFSKSQNLKRHVQIIHKAGQFFLQKTFRYSKPSTYLLHLLTGHLI